MSDHTCDLLILGSGSTAFAAALRARELGKTAMMIEERTVGGTCVNRGCLPSKNLIEAARRVHEAGHPRYPGLTARGVDLDFPVLVAQKDELVGAYRGKKYESLTGDGIRIVRGHGWFVDVLTVAVGEERWSGRAILIATGSRPTTPDIPGLDGIPFLTSDLLTAEEDTELKELPASLLIVGGGFIALELGQMFARFGSQVTILERSGQLLPRGYEPEVSPAIATVLRDEGVRVETNAEVRRVAGDGGQVRLTVWSGDGEREIQAERLIVAMGRRPNTDAIGIKNAGVRVDDQGAIEVDEHLRTNVRQILAAGDVIGRHTGSQMATPVGSHDGVIAAHNALAETEPRAEDFIDLVHVYPTMAEALKIAAISRFKDPSKLSCCAE